MKAFSIAVAVTLVLAFICILESSAVPFDGVREPEEAGGSDDTPDAAHRHEPSMGTIPSFFRRKRQSHLSLCRFCCNCCKSYKGCGYCCLF